MMHKIELKKGQIINKSELLRICQSALGGFNYVEIKLSDRHNTWFHVNFNRDLTISLSTNNRELGMYNEIQFLMRNYTMMRLVDFLFKWINILNK